MSRAACAALAVAVGLVAPGGCAASPPPAPDLVGYGIRGGAIRVDVPAAWGTVYSWQVAEPRGSGLQVIAGSGTSSRVRFAVAASSVALREAPLRPAATDRYSFQQTLRAAEAIHRVPSFDCADAVVRPVTNDRLYGRLVVREGCPDGETFAQIMAIDAQRTVLVTIEARSPAGTRSADVVGSAFATLEVDPLALPVAPIAADQLLRTPG